MIIQCLAVIYGLGIFHTTTGHSEMNGTTDVIKGKELHNNRFVRNSEIQDPYNVNSQSRFVELMIVYDKRAYEEMNNSLEAVVAHSKQLANAVNAIYEPLNIYVALVGTIVWSDFDEINISDNFDNTLTNFLHYRKKQLIHKFPNDNAVLISSFNPNYWSSCSKDFLSKSFKRGLDYCLRNKPKTVLGPICGNGFVENGEECDCGLQSVCDNSCCNATSCTLFPNAFCATGSCCNLCQVRSVGALCRHVASECDLPEYCDGISEVCPKDIFKPNGVSCGIKEAYCSDGQCNSHDDQCKLLWGPSGKVADQQCFGMNTKGNSRGNCGHFIGNGTSKPCSEEDVFCGLLHCTHSSERLEFGLESTAHLSRSYINSHGKVLGCKTVILDLGLDVINPGLVPNGAKCGENKMCFNQQCIPVDKATTSQCIADCENYQGGGALGLLKPIISFLTPYLFR